MKGLMIMNFVIVVRGLSSVVMVDLDTRGSACIVDMNLLCTNAAKSSKC